MLKLILPDSQKFDLNSNSALAQPAGSAREQFLTDKASLAFAQLPYQEEALLRELTEAEKYAEGMDTFVVIGIGGSDLGTRTVVNALLSNYQRRIYFAGDTTDPKQLVDLSAELDLAKTLFIVVSKSGNTVEPAAAFIYFQDLANQQLGAETAVKHFVLLTDAHSGSLRKLASDKGYPSVVHGEVGGRYSVLSTVGMLPAHYLGLNVAEFLRGARELADQLVQSASNQDFALSYAVWLFQQAQSGKNINVLIPYAYGLTEFSMWFKQLWAESLGKNNSGTTPYNVVGPAFQHSTLQLFNEGPDDKMFTFITAKRARQDVNLPPDAAGLADFQFLAGRSFQEILTGEYETTSFALRKYGRQMATLEIDQLDEYNLGQLFYFFELVTLYSGYMYRVNPFDQPGVELSKNAMFGLLGKPGFEQYRDEFQQG